MVLGLKSKKRKKVSFQVDYLINVQEVKPWPKSQSLKSTQSVVVQWENGDKNFGSFTCGVGDGSLGIGESFRLSVTLCREASRKSTNPESFKKNILEFYLYEPRKDRAVKGQRLGSAAINLADYGVIKETITISAQLNCKRSFKTSAQPVLYVNIQPLERDSSGSSPYSSLSKEVSLDEGQLLSGLDNEGNDEEVEIASLTDDDDDRDVDDLSSHSAGTIPSSASETKGGSPLQTDQKKSASVKDNTASVKVEILEDREKKEVRQIGEEAQTLEVKKYQIEENQVFGNLAGDANRKQVKLRNDTLSFSRNSTGLQENFPKTNKLKHLRSVQFPYNSPDTSEILSTSQLIGKRNNIPAPEAASVTRRIESKATMTSFSDGKVELESKIEMLEEELREAAAVEVALYSVVAEHGSSAIKVHAPARRLSRFYLHACKARSPANRASAARTAVSGLVLVAKACGNDVPRLTFWLSNSILLRAIVSQAVKKLQLSSLKQKNSTVQYTGDWEDPQTFIVALENVEAWVFNRIIESVWWQTLTPHMQPTAAKSSGSRKTHGRRYGLGDQEQGNFSIDLWKKAFQDACERLCPLRAGGHECGCLTLLPKLVMQQLVCRLDVAMFNAILRESADEMPTDPVSDPISDSKVLPIPAGKSSFGSGAQLKNAIGSWSRWLTDLFGIDDADAYEDEENKLDDDKKEECETSSKAFHLLNALSDLMMLPLDMLADRSTRKEVCPKFGASLVKRALYNFVPDEFCPDPIPDAVLEALDSEDLLEAEEDTITTFPCTAAPTVYRPPPAASLTDIIGEVGSPSMTNESPVLRKAYTSDDELEELDSPTSSIVTDNSRASRGLVKTSLMLKKGGGRKVVRYQLLREVWRDG